MSTVVAESGAQLVARISSELRPTIENVCNDLFPDNGPLPGNVIEITGESNTGKSHILMEIMARTILPVEYGGRGARSVFLNLDNNFKLQRFLHILEKIACAAKESSEEKLTKQAIENSLNNLLVFNCYTPEEYELAQMQLERMLIADLNISLVAIDSMSAFYWLDCKQVKIVKMETYLKRAIQTYQRICQEFKIVVAYVRPSYFASLSDQNRTTDASSPDYRVKLTSHNPEGAGAFEAEIDAKGHLQTTFYTVDNFGVKFLKL